MINQDKYIIKIEHVSKEFPGVKALNDVHFGIKEGEIHGLVGENGAGKSTLIKILSGIYSLDEGQIYFNEEPVLIKNVDDAKKLGIAVIHQELSMAGCMTVAENIFLGRFPMKGIFVDREKMERDAGDLMNLIGLKNIDPDTVVKYLSTGQQQMVEICRALSQNIKLLIMDEPTASLAQEETEILMNIMRELKAKGVSILFVSHKLNEIFEICDRITVFRDGQYISTCNTEELKYDDLIRMMVGREIENIFPPHNTKPGDVFFEAKNITSAKVDDVSFNLRKGEILGFYGLIGAGRSELMNALLGIDLSSKGEIILNGEVITIKNPTEAVERGIVFAPEDRKSLGLFLKKSIDFNITISILENIIHGIKLDKKLNEDTVVDIGEKLKIKTPSYDTPVVSLSGGNQQKVVLAKWLVKKPDILILDEATRGIDVGAKQEIYRLVYEIAETGVSIIFISSEMAEILNLCDRVNVMYNGKITDTFDRNELNDSAILKSALGGINNGK